MKHLREFITEHRVGPRDLPLLLVWCAVWAYVMARAVHVSFSWDEAYTYLHHVRPGVLWPDRFDAMGANHHLLNVWLMWLANGLLGNAEWMLRAPNVFAGALYLTVAFLLVRNVRPWPVSLCLFLLLTVHPYMLDMFSLARGYGLGMAFMLLSLVMLRKYASSFRTSTGAWAVFAAGSASLSNLTFLNFLLAVLATLFVVLMIKGDTLRSKWMRLVLFIATAAPFLMINAVLTWHLKAGGSLYFGSSDIEGVIWSVAIKMFYHLPDYEDPVSTFKWVLAISLLIPFISLVIVVVRRQREVAWPLLPGLLVLVFWTAGLGFEHLVFGTPLPHARTGVPIIPLASFLLVTTLMSPAMGRFAGRAAACILVIPLCQLQVRAYNLAYTIEWRVSGQVREMFETIQKDMATVLPHRPVRTVLSGFESYMPLRYYAERDGADRLVIHQMRNGEPFLRWDYYIVEFDALDKIDTVNWDLRFDGTATNTRLFQDARNVGIHKRLAHTQYGSLGNEEWTGHRMLKGDQRYGGTIRYVFNEETARDPWLVVDMEVRADGKDDWISFDLGIRRNGVNLESRTTYTQEGARGPEWERLALAFGPSLEVLAGDTLEMTIWAATGQREQWVARPELRVYLPDAK
ncbi:MAG: hypothetical protein JNL52_05505 [Flavobacteriales bacterium]|nr:hypothetical protein [Flavobacteriales bacterium]